MHISGETIATIILAILGGYVFLKAEKTVTKFVLVGVFILVLVFVVVPKLRGM